MRKLVKIEVSELGDDLLATDGEGKVYPVSYACVQELAREDGRTLVEEVTLCLQQWGSTDPEYKTITGNDDWKTIYEAEQ